MAAERKRLRLIAARATKLAEEEIARSQQLTQPKTHNKSSPKVPSVPQPAFHPSSSKRVPILEPSTRLETKPAPKVTKPSPTVTKPAPTVTKPPPTVTKPAPTVTKPAPTVTKPAPTVTKPAPTVTKPAPTVTKPPPTVTKPAPTVTKPAPTVTKPAPSYKQPPQHSLRFPTPPKKTQEDLNRILVNLSQEANDLRSSVNTVERKIAKQNDRTFSRCEVLACLAASLAEEWPSSVESIVREHRYEDTLSRLIILVALAFNELAYRHRGVRMDTSSKEMRMVEGLLKLTATITSTQEGYLYLHNSPAGQAALVTFSQFITEIPIPSGETMIRELLLVLLNMWHRPHDMEYFERRSEHFEVIQYIFRSRGSSETLLHLTLLLLLFVITGVQSAIAYRNLNHFIPKDRLRQIAAESKNLEITGVAQDIMNAWDRSAQQFAGRGDP